MTNYDDDFPEPPECDDADEVPPLEAASVRRWTVHELNTVARALLAGQTAGECAAQLSGRSVGAVKAQAAKLIAEGAARNPPVVLPPFVRLRASLDWEALRVEAEARQAVDRTGEV